MKPTIIFVSANSGISEFLYEAHTSRTEEKIDYVMSFRKVFKWKSNHQERKSSIFFFQVKDGHFGIHNNKDSFSGLRGAFNSRG